MHEKDMRVCVLPGLDKTDGVYFDDSCTDSDCCALTMESVLLADTRATAELYVAQEKLESEKHKELLALARELPQLPPLRIKACAHVFSSMELLMMTATRGFQCPVCRHGSGKHLELALRTARMRHVPSAVWRFVCEFGLLVRARLKLEAQQEIERENAEIRALELNVVRSLPARTLAQLCTFELTVAVYMTDMGTGRNAPHIPKMVYRVPMRIVDGERASAPDMLEAETGRCRSLSQSMNKARWFTARVDLQMDDDDIALIVGAPVLCVKHRSQAARPATVIDQFTSGPENGVLQITHQPCVYSGEHMVARISYRIHDDAFRNLVEHYLTEAMSGLE